MSILRLIGAPALCLIVFWHAPNAVAALSLPREGWASWQVPAVENAPEWCCVDFKGNRRPCKLDGERNSYGGLDDTTDSVRVYAHLSGGTIDRLRTLSTTCPVQADTPIQELSVSADDSARWLVALIQERAPDPERHDRIVHDVLAALAIHRGRVAHDALVSIARRDTREDTRKQAVFWLALVRGVEGAQTATSIMFDDPNATIREHAAFAVSQSKSPSADRDLIRLANTDSAAKVRSHAWFSLALTQSPNAEEAIEAALRKEKDRDVREQAIFALSQLPDERATRALIKVAEDKSLGREERKRAVFWLGQSESRSAQTYLESVLAKVPE